MKIAVSAAGADLNALVDPRFGRCPFFIIVDTDTMKFEAIPNTSQQTLSGAGIEAAQTIASKGVGVVLTGSIGPNAYQALLSAGIRVVTGITGTVKEAVEKCRRGELNANFPAAPPAHRPRYGGYGRRGWQDMRIGNSPDELGGLPYAGAPPFSTAPLNREQEIQMLQARMKMLQDQLNWIEKRLEELKK